MEPTLISGTRLENSAAEDVLVDTRCARQLQGLGLPQMLADTFADLIDWAEIATFLEHSRAPELALEIAR